MCDSGNYNEFTVCCGYALHTMNTCLRRDGEDIRGEDPKKCKLYTKGDAPRKQFRMGKSKESQSK